MLSVVDWPCLGGDLDGRIAVVLLLPRRHHHPSITARRTTDTWWQQTDMADIHI